MKVLKVLLSAAVLILAAGILFFTLYDTNKVFDNASANEAQTYTEASEPVSESEYVSPSKQVTEVVQESSDVLQPYTQTVSIDDIPDYSGSPYIELNNNIPQFDDISTESFEYYSELDDLGRCGMCIACIGQDLMPTEERGEIGMIKPSGWHTVRYDDLIEDKYLYNRCHLIGYLLTGENDNVCNLITGTRYLNVSGMLPFEERTASFISNTGNHVMYRVTPVFDGTDLVAKGVHMEAYSVEDSGAGISFNVYCYNIQPGITIDYTTGDSAKSAYPPSEYDLNTESASDSSDECTYILNNNTKRFHYPYCDSVNEMKEKNKEEYTGTREELIDRGYKPCGVCRP